MMEKPKLFIILGPTASGKSTQALKLAQIHNEQARKSCIINADSMQVYSNLPIITAMPTPKDQETCPHKLYGVLDAMHARCDVSWWRDQCLHAIKTAIAKNEVPIVVGGTGLYILALLNGLSQIPDIPEDVRSYARGLSFEEAQKELKQLDPLNEPPKDKQRTVRQLEVMKTTGKPLRSFQNKNSDLRDLCDIDIQLIDDERDVLAKRAQKRIEWMFDHGAITEVESFIANIPMQDNPLLKAVGVKEIIAFLSGDLTLAQAKEKMLISTRQYIKRQQTFFKNQVNDF